MLIITIVAISKLVIGTIWQFSPERTEIEQIITSDQSVILATGNITSIHFRAYRRVDDGIHHDGSISRGYEQYRLIVKGEEDSAFVTLKKGGDEGFRIISIESWLPAAPEAAN